MNIYLQELKFYRRVTIIWALVFAFGIFGYLSIFTSFTSDVTATMKILEGFPPAVRAALGIQLKTFFTIYGFFGYMLTYLWLVGAIQAMNLGIGIISKEISGKTADFLLSKPVSRVKVLTSKLSAALTLLLATNVVFISAAYFSARVFSTSSIKLGSFILVAATVLIVQLFFLALGYLIAVVVPKIKSVLAYSLPIVFGFFIVGLLDSVIGLENLRYVTPFKYFDVQYIVKNNMYDLKYIFTEVVVVIACVLVGYLLYLRKDIQAGA
jgi:ABC-2 type transport system permease protein